jgi:dolichyl-diphosphooligosaccharide--protein glycosyltransferase
LEFIKKDSSQDAVINSWWDYGHWFTAVAKRRVLFDGKTQNSPVAFWMARVLTTDDEKEAAGILRILDISKNKAFDLLESYGFSHAQAVEILCDISKLSKADARNYLSQTLSEEKISELMPLLYQDNMPAAYLIVSFDMMMKMRSISHIGNWDFKKGDIWLHFSSTNPPQFVDYLKKQYGYDKKEISSLLKDLSLFNEKEALGWISRVDNIYPNSFSNKFKAADNLAVFDNALTLDLSNYNAYIVRGPDIDIGIPYSVVYLKDRIPKENILSGSNLEYSVAVMKDKDSFKSIFLDKDLTQSMFSRMYFFKGEGLKYFKKVSEEKTPEGNYIFVYKIEWPK